MYNVQKQFISMFDLRPLGSGSREVASGKFSVENMLTDSQSFKTLNNHNFRDILAGAADEILMVLKNDKVSSKEKKKVYCSLLG